MEMLTIPREDIFFNYRSCNLNKDLIFLSASFKGKKDNKDNIKKNEKIKNQKRKSSTY